MKKELDEKEKRLNERLKELDKKEKELKRSNKLKYGPGNRAEMIGLTVFACMVIAILGVYLVQQYVNDDEDNAAAVSGTTAYQPPRRTSSVSTGGSAAQPTEIYPDDDTGDIDEQPTDGVTDDDEQPSDSASVADGSPVSATPEGGFSYSGIALPSAPAATTISAHEIQIGGDGFVADGLGGGFNEIDGLLPPQDADSIADGTEDTSDGADEPDAAETLPTGSTNAPSAGNEPVYDAVVPSVTATSSSVTAATPPRGEALYVDPESTMGHNAQEFFG